jgi:hypothetical protein
MKYSQNLKKSQNRLPLLDSVFLGGRGMREKYRLEEYVKKLWKIGGCFNALMDCFLTFFLFVEKV